MAGSAMELRGAEIRHLAALVAVAREQSFNRAAHGLGCAPSTLTRQLIELERAAGAPLVEPGRGAGPDGLTDAGRLLLRHAKAVIARLWAARADLEALERGPSLRIGVCEAVTSRIVQAILRAQPNASLLPTIAGDDAELIHRVEQGSVDLSLVTLPLPPGPFEFVRLLDEPPRTIGIAWHRYRRLPPTAERFRQAAVAACATLEDRPE